MPWQASPSPGVWRKRLEHVGEPEAGRVTSIVRYDPGSVFPPHRHPQGEEIMVLEGVFEDEHGVYRAGTWLLNPDGSQHAPRSESGCVLFVKLKQYPGTTRRVIDTNAARWRPLGEGVEFQPLHAGADGFGAVALLRLTPGARWRADGEGECLVLEGELESKLESNLESNLVTCRAHAWLRWPIGRSIELQARTRARLYVRLARSSLASAGEEGLGTVTAAGR